MAILHVESICSGRLILFFTRKLLGVFLVEVHGEFGLWLHFGDVKDARERLDLRNYRSITNISLFDNFSLLISGVIVGLLRDLLGLMLLRFLTKRVVEANTIRDS